MGFAALFGRFGSTPITGGSRFTPTFNSPNERYPPESLVSPDAGSWGPDGDNFTGTFAGGGGSIPVIPGTCTGVLSVSDLGVAANGVSVFLQMEKPPSGFGAVLNMDVKEQVSTDGGVVFSGLTVDATYNVWVGAKKTNYYRTYIPADAVDTVFNLANVLGKFN